MTWAMLVSIPKTSNATKITNTKNRIENVLVDIALEKKKKLELAKQAKQSKHLHSPTKHPLVSFRDCVGIDHIQRERKEQEIKMEEPHKEEQQTETKHYPNAKKQLTKTQVRKSQTEQKRRKREEENARCWEEIEKLVLKM